MAINLASVGKQLSGFVGQNVNPQFSMKPKKLAEGDTVEDSVAMEQVTYERADGSKVTYKYNPETHSKPRPDGQMRRLNVNPDDVARVGGLVLFDTAETVDIPAEATGQVEEKVKEEVKETPYTSSDVPGWGVDIPSGIEYEPGRQSLSMRDTQTAAMNQLVNKGLSTVVPQYLRGVLGIDEGLKQGERNVLSNIPAEYLSTRTGEPVASFEDLTEKDRENISLYDMAFPFGIGADANNPMQNMERDAIAYAQGKNRQDVSEGDIKKFDADMTPGGPKGLGFDFRGDFWAEDPKYGIAYNVRTGMDERGLVVAKPNWNLEDQFRNQTGPYKSKMGEERETGTDRERPSWEATRETFSPEFTPAGMPDPNYAGDTPLNMADAFNYPSTQTSPDPNASLEWGGKGIPTEEELETIRAMGERDKEGAPFSPDSTPPPSGAGGSWMGNISDKDFDPSDPNASPEWGGKGIPTERGFASPEWGGAGRPIDLTTFTPDVADIPANVPTFNLPGRKPSTFELDPADPKAASNTARAIATSLGMRTTSKPATVAEELADKGKLDREEDTRQIEKDLARDEKFASIAGKTPGMKPPDTSKEELIKKDAEAFGKEFAALTKITPGLLAGVSPQTAGVPPSVWSKGFDGLTFGSEDAYFDTVQSGIRGRLDEEDRQRTFERANAYLHTDPQLAGDIIAAGLEGQPDAPADWDETVDYGSPFQQGGPVRFNEGGLASISNQHLEPGSFVVAADVMSGLGDGSSEAGFERLSGLLGIPLDNSASIGGPMFGKVEGTGTGLDDMIHTTIQSSDGKSGKQAARVAREEAVLTPESLRYIDKHFGTGKGDLGNAHKMFANLQQNVRNQKTGGRQPGPLIKEGASVEKGLSQLFQKA